MENKIKYASGAIKSPYDIRTFKFKPSREASLLGGMVGGERYKPEDIEDQHSVGICTALSLTQNARKALGMKFSADFQYLCQKKFYDNPYYKDWDWGEGSSIFHALKVALNIGLLPEEHWTFTTEEDRKLPYSKYIEKLRTIPDYEIDKLKAIASKYKIKAYAAVPVTRDAIAAAIADSKAGILSRFTIGGEWWAAPIEPLRAPVKPVSGHAVIETNYDGDSFRIANIWGKEWASQGTAYRLHAKYAPTESWAVYYNDLPTVIINQIETKESLMWLILTKIQQLITLLQTKKQKVA